MNERNRLRWRCRRGMRELDMVFEAYLDRYYDAASTEDQAIFERLIAVNDADIYAWLMAYAEPTEAEFVPIIKCMRQLLGSV